MSNKERVRSPEVQGLRNCILTFRTVNGDILAWCVRTDAIAEEIPNLIETAATEWLLSPVGRQFVHDQELGEWGFDYWQALKEIPYETLSKYGIFPWVPIDSVVELDPDENLLPEELRQSNRSLRKRKSA